MERQMEKAISAYAGKFDFKNAWADFDDIDTKGVVVDPFLEWEIVE